MTLQEMIDSLQDQAQDKDNLAIGDPFGPDDPENIFAQDTKALREAARLLGEMKLPNDRPTNLGGAAGDGRCRCVGFLSIEFKR